MHFFSISWGRNHAWREKSSIFEGETLKERIFLVSVLKWFPFVNCSFHKYDKKFS